MTRALWNELIENDRALFSRLFIPLIFWVRGDGNVTPPPPPGRGWLVYPLGCESLLLYISATNKYCQQQICLFDIWHVCSPCIILRHILGLLKFLNILDFTHWNKFYKFTLWKSSTHIEESKKVAVQNSSLCVFWFFSLQMSGKKSIYDEVPNIWTFGLE